MTMTGEATDERLITPRFVLVVVVGLAYFLSLGMLLPVVPLYVKDALGGGDVAVGVAVGAFSFGAVLVRPFAGRIGDRLGRRVLIVGGALVVGVSALLYHLATIEAVLIVVRVIGGVGEAAFFVGAGTMITDLAPEDRRGEAISYWSVAVYGGLAFGPMLGEVLLGVDDFDRVWLVAAGLALGAAALGLLTTESVGEGAVASPEEAALALAAAESGAPPVKAPLLHRASLAPGAVLFLGLVGLAGFTEFVRIYVGEIGMADSKSVFLLYGCVVLAVRIFGARLPDRMGPLRAGSGATGIGAAGLVVVAAIHQPIGLYLGTAIFAVGMSLLYPAMLTLALTGVPSSERGSAVGTISSFFDASQALGAFILGGVAAAGGYRASFLGGAFFALVGLVVLRSGIDPRTRVPTDHAAAAVSRQFLEPDPP
jgi:MFS family permease